MPSPIIPLLALALALTAAGGQSAQDDGVEQTRVRIEGERRELVASIGDAAWKQDSSRATLVRVSIERTWRLCAENEALALARVSEKPARLLAEAALAKCRAWQDALDLALRNGANPYLDGRVSNEDMISSAELKSRDAALARILMSRGRVVAPVEASPVPSGETHKATPRPTVMTQPAFPLASSAAPAITAEAPHAAAPPAGQTEIVVVGKRQGGCRVRLADHLLTEGELARHARQWAADGTRLRVIQPRGADYDCLSRIVWSLGKYGVHLFEFVDP